MAILGLDIVVVSVVATCASTTGSGAGAAAGAEEVATGAGWVLGVVVEGFFDGVGSSERRAF